MSEKHVPKYGEVKPHLPHAKMTKLTPQEHVHIEHHHQMHAEAAEAKGDTELAQKHKDMAAMHMNYAHSHYTPAHSNPYAAVHRGTKHLSHVRQLASKRKKWAKEYHDKLSGKILLKSAIERARDLLSQRINKSVGAAPAAPAPAKHKSMKAPVTPSFARTKSGKEIHEDPSHASHKTFSRQDHIDAYFAHGQAVKHAASVASVQHHENAMKHHWAASNAAKDVKKSLSELLDLFKAKKKHPEQGEEIGHTRSGKPIYHSKHKHKHPLYAHYSHDDHHDAAHQHHGRAMMYLQAHKAALKAGKKSGHVDKFEEHLESAVGHARESHKKKGK